MPSEPDLRQRWIYHVNGGWYEHPEVDAMLVWSGATVPGWHLTVDGVEHGFVGVEASAAMEAAESIIKATT